MDRFWHDWPADRVFRFIDSEEFYVQCVALLFRRDTPKAIREAVLALSRN